MRDLTPTEERIAALLLAGYTRKEMCKELGIKIRTLKAHFNRMFLKFGIDDGIKRVKLAVVLYRRQNGGKSKA